MSALDPLKTLRNALVLLAGLGVLQASIAATEVRADLECAVGSAGGEPSRAPAAAADDCASSRADTSNVRLPAPGDLQGGTPSPKPERAAPAGAEPAPPTRMLAVHPPASAERSAPRRPVYLLTRRLRV